MTDDSENNQLLELREELTLDTIGSRLKILILAETPEKRRFPTLEHLTGVPENTWRSWWSKKGAIPNGSLVAGAARVWPQFAFWLATGLTDIEYGHCMPYLSLVSGYVHNFPERSDIKDRVYAAEYFKICREIKDIDAANTTHLNANDKERKLVHSDRREEMDILKNTRKFIMKKRREEVFTGKFKDRILSLKYTIDDL